MPPLPERTCPLPSILKAAPRPHSDRGQGRHPFAPTPIQRQVVTMSRGAGVPPDEIARQLGVSEKTLRKRFREEMARGKAMVVARIGAKVVQKALAGDNTMIQFYLNRFGGSLWHDKQRHEHTGKNGAPTLQPPNLILTFLEDKPES